MRLAAVTSPRIRGENMFDQSSRTIWLNDSLWPKIREQFGFSTLPSHGLFTVGYPSSGARGRSEKIKPAEINYQWTGNPNEPFMVLVHPVYFDTPENVIKAIAFAAAKATRGARWGPSHVGLTKQDDGCITANHDAEVKIKAIMADVGDPPPGYGLPFPVKDVQRARLLEYRCESACTKDYGARLGHTHPRIRIASPLSELLCSCCGAAYKLV